MSPRGEWIDLDIDLDKPHDEDGCARQHSAHHLFRSQGPASARHQIAWQAPVSNSFRRAGALWSDNTLEDERMKVVSETSATSSILRFI